MNSVQPAPPPDEVDLGRLNQAEREALHLLAEGHTAKSIATLTGRTVVAVNERLREARRKTGVGSSRELARLLKTRKNYDEQIGMAPAAAFVAAASREAGPVAAPRTPKGLIVMIILSGIGVIAALLAFQDAPQGEPGDASAASRAATGDEVLGSLLSPRESDPRYWHDRLQSETRDPAWAPKTEAAIRQRYARVRHVGSAGHPLRVTCGASVCEVLGTLDLDEKGVDGVNRIIRALKTGATGDDGGMAGLKMETAAFGPEHAFASYWSRME